MAGFYLSPLLLVLQLTTLQFSFGVGQQVGVSLMVQGVAAPNNSLVDVSDLLYRTNHEPELEDPSNNNSMLHNAALLCVTDLVDCCESPPRGDWYYPNGSVVEFDGNPWNTVFRSNKGQNEIRDGRQFYGSVRLWRRFTPTQKGHFYCEIPSAANPNVSQTLYANLVDFGFLRDSVIISPSTGSTNTTAGERDYSLTCSAILYDPVPLPDDVPSPNFQWFFNGSASLPSGVTATPTVMSSSNSTSETYTSTLQFSPLSQSHAGSYICRLGPGRLVSSAAMVTVNAPSIAAMVTANLNTPLMAGQTGSTLTCDVSGAESLNPTITYQWTRNGETLPDTSSGTLTLSPLQLSHSGNYTCSTTISSSLLDDDITAISDNNLNITIPIPDPQSVSLTSSSGTTVINGSHVTITCTVELGPSVSESDLSLLMVDAQLFVRRNGVTKNLSSTQIVSGTTLTYATAVNSFGMSDSGNYSCVATTRPSSVYLYGTSELSNQIQVTTGVYFSSRSSYINTNSNIFITDIGEGDCGALLCYTDLTECCGDGDTPVGVGALGQWVYPNGSVVGTESDGQGFYINRGPSVVRLNRRRNPTSTTGLFCCEVPDATARNTKICVNVVPFAPQSTPEATCMSDVSKVVYAVIGVAAILLIESLIGAPIIVTVVLCRKRRGKSRGKNIYDIHNVIAENKFYNGPKKDAYELSTTPTAPTTTLNSRALREDVYEDPNHANHMVGNHTNATGERNSETDDTYELMEANTLQGAAVGEDGNLVYTYVNTPGSMANTAPPRVHVAATTAEQPGGVGMEDDTYEISDHDIVDTSAAHSVTLAVPGAQGGGGDNGVRESVYEDPDNPTHQPPVRFQLTECQAYT